MVVVGAMIGSSIFIVPAEMARHIGSAGWLLVAWGVAGILTIAGALCYGELSVMMPQAGGMYVYLREAYSPLWGFLYGWTLFSVIETGTIAAVAVAFARFSGVLWPLISEDKYLIAPFRLSSHYALSHSTAQLLAIGVIALLTFSNTLGLRYGKLIQNVFTIAKTGALGGPIVLGILLGRNASALHANFSSPWHARGIDSLGGGLTAATMSGLLIAICLSQTGSLFSADSWHNIAFAAAAVKKPERNVTLAMVIGATVVIVLYVRVSGHAPFGGNPACAGRSGGDRDVAGDLSGCWDFGHGGGHHGLDLRHDQRPHLDGSTRLLCEARQQLFFPFASRLNSANVPAYSLTLQGLWAALLVLPRTYDTATKAWGNLYSNLLEYVISAALIFYVLTVAGVFRLRIKRPDAPRPYRAIGYPVVPAFYILAASAILAVLFAYRPATTWPGLLIVLLGAPIYLLIGWAGRGRDAKTSHSQAVDLQDAT